MERLDDAALKAKTGEFRQRLERGEDLDDLLIEAFAVVREAGRRVLGQRHYDVQLIGGAALHFGWIAEMKTGEGKTLVSTLPGLPQRPGRARRPPHHGQRVPGPPRLRVDGPPAPLARASASASSCPATSTPTYKREQYAADITYGTNNEFGFDYLRDNMAMGRERQVQRGLPLRDRRRGRLDPHRRGADAAHHLRAGRRRRAALLQVRQHRPRPAPRRGLRGRRAEAHRVAHRAGHREGRARARHRQPLRRRRPEPRPPAPGRAAGQGAVQARQGLHHVRRRATAALPRSAWCRRAARPRPAVGSPLADARRWSRSPWPCTACAADGSRPASGWWS